MTTLEILAAVFAAEMITGAVHWWEDRYGDPSWPVIGKHVIEPNITHHTDQTRFTRGDYWTRNWTTLLPSLSLAAACASAGAWWWALVWAIASQANEIHCWAHMKCSRPIRGLQLLGILQSPDAHQQHHRQPFDTSFCTMTDFTNPVLNAIRFWPALEAVVGLCGVHPRPERRQA